MTLSDREWAALEAQMLKYEVQAKLTLESAGYRNAVGETWELPHQAVFANWKVAHQHLQAQQKTEAMIAWFREFYADVHMQVIAWADNNNSLVAGIPLGRPDEVKLSWETWVKLIRIFNTEKPE